MFAAVGEEPAFPDDAVEVGRIVGAWGVKGGIKVKPFSGDPQALFATKRWHLQAPALAPGIGPKPAAKATTGATATTKSGAALSWPRLLRIVQAREQGEHVVATVRDLDDRDEAQALNGARIFVSRASFPTPGEDEFYWVDLIGLEVHNREGFAFGSVVGLVETGPHCVLRVQRAPDERDALLPEPQAASAAPRECLIPFVSAYIDRVDLAERRLVVDWQPDF